ncbi:hypothetical protein [Ramlibacter sp. AN1133]|uniref:hypothetical protein n=1 Tax=Ramlibacter sp. AN1133 TaxID=3133429 RepID=UPI0030C5959F
MRFYARWILAAALVSPGLAYAACSSSLGDAGYCDQVLVKRVYMDATSNAYVEVDGNTSALGCKLDGPWIMLPMNLQNSKAVYATLLAAQVAARPVQVRMVPSAAACTVAYVLMY